MTVGKLDAGVCAPSRLPELFSHKVAAKCFVGPLSLRFVTNLRSCSASPGTHCGGWFDAGMQALGPKLAPLRSGFRRPILVRSSSGQYRCDRCSIDAGGILVCFCQALTKPMFSY